MWVVGTMVGIWYTSVVHGTDMSYVLTAMEKIIYNNSILVYVHIIKNHIFWTDIMTSECARAVRWRNVSICRLEITFFTRVLIYLLPGICIYSLEHLKDFCWTRFSSLKVKIHGNIITQMKCIIFSKMHIKWL